MAALTNVHLDDVWREFMQVLSNVREPIVGMDKHDIRVALISTDAHQNATAAAHHASLPAAAKANMTPTQRSLMSKLVSTKRHQEGV